MVDHLDARAIGRQVSGPPMAVPSLATAACRLFFKSEELRPAVRADDGPAAAGFIPGLACLTFVVHVHRELVVREELDGVFGHFAVGV
eukprot:6464388-Pyramimonas_sp.AAC.1